MIKEKDNLEECDYYMNEEILATIVHEHLSNFDTLYQESADKDINSNNNSVDIFSKNKKVITEYLNDAEFNSEIKTLQKKELAVNSLEKLNELDYSDIGEILLQMIVYKKENKLLTKKIQFLENLIKHLKDEKYFSMYIRNSKEFILHLKEKDSELKNALNLTQNDNNDVFYSLTENKNNKGYYKVNKSSNKNTNRSKSKTDNKRRKKKVIVEVNKSTNKMIDSNKY